MQHGWGPWGLGSWCRRAVIARLGATQLLHGTVAVLSGVLYGADGWHVALQWKEVVAHSSRLRRRRALIYRGDEQGNAPINGRICGREVSGNVSEVEDKWTAMRALKGRWVNTGPEVRGGPHRRRKGSMAVSMVEGGHRGSMDGGGASAPARAGGWPLSDEQGGLNAMY
jgi:hypothetical protein